MMKPSFTIATNVGVIKNNKYYLACFLIKIKQISDLHFACILPSFLWFFLLSTSIFGQEAFRGSTVVYFRSPKEIVVGSDSMAIAVQDSSVVGTACKIMQIENSHMFMAMTGLSPYGAAKYNYMPQVTQAYRANRTIRKTANAFSRNIIPWLTKNLKELRNDPRVDYGRDFEGKPALAMLFFGFENSIPVVSHREFKAITNARGEIQLSPLVVDCPGKLCPDGWVGAFMGEWDAIRQAMTADPKSFNIKNENLTELTERLIQIEIDYFKDNPRQKVGPPIDIFRMTKTGPEWIKKKQECADVQPYSTPTPRRQIRSTRKKRAPATHY